MKKKIKKMEAGCHVQLRMGLGNVLLKSLKDRYGLKMGGRYLIKRIDHCPSCTSKGCEWTTHPEGHPRCAGYVVLSGEHNTPSCFGYAEGYALERTDDPQPSYPLYKTLDEILGLVDG